MGGRPQPHENSVSFVLLKSFMDSREAGWFSRGKRTSLSGILNPVQPGPPHGL